MYVICILQEYSDVFTWMVRVPSSLTNICPCVVPANINSWLPSLVQKTEGGGFPVAWHSNLAMPFMPTLWSLGLTRKLGCAVEEEKDWDSKIRLLHDHLEILWHVDLDFLKVFSIILKTLKLRDKLDAVISKFWNLECSCSSSIVWANKRLAKGSFYDWSEQIAQVFGDTLLQQ